MRSTYNWASLRQGSHSRLPSLKLAASGRALWSPNRDPSGIRLFAGLHHKIQDDVNALLPSLLLLPTMAHATTAVVVSTVLIGLSQNPAAQASACCHSCARYHARTTYDHACTRHGVQASLHARCTSYAQYMHCIPASL